MVTIQKNLNDQIVPSPKMTRSKSRQHSRPRASAYEDFKRQHPDRVEAAKAIIIRLERNQRPHVREQATTLDWWDARLQVTIAPTYMEKRVRQQILRGLLRECGIMGVRTSTA